MHLCTQNVYARASLESLPLRIEHSKNPFNTINSEELKKLLEIIDHYRMIEHFYRISISPYTIESGNATSGSDGIGESYDPILGVAVRLEKGGDYLLIAKISAPKKNSMPLIGGPYQSTFDALKKTLLGYAKDHGMGFTETWIEKTSSGGGMGIAGGGGQHTEFKGVRLLDVDLFKLLPELPEQLKLLKQLEVNIDVPHIRNTERPLDEKNFALIYLAEDRDYQKIDKFLKLKLPIQSKDETLAHGLLTTVLAANEDYSGEEGLKHKSIVDALVHEVSIKNTALRNILLERLAGSETHAKLLDWLRSGAGEESRVREVIKYFEPPRYDLPSFQMDAFKRRTESGDRIILAAKSMSFESRLQILIGFTNRWGGFQRIAFELYGSPEERKQMSDKFKRAEVEHFERFRKLGLPWAHDESEKAKFVSGLKKWFDKKEPEVERVIKELLSRRT